MVRVIPTTGLLILSIPEDVSFLSRGCTCFEEDTILIGGEQKSSMHLYLEILHPSRRVLDANLLILQLHFWNS